MDFRKILKYSTVGEQFPFSVTVGKGMGPTVLITAGMDGDEYAGIQTALTLKNDPFLLSFPGTINIVPIVNREGFLSGVSFHPADRKYPKHIFPGKKYGTASEQVIASLWHRFGGNVSLWLDLHGGAHHEHLVPFIQGYPTGIQSVDKKTISLLDALHFEHSVFDQWSKVPLIARKGCQYVLFEAGEKGVYLKKDIETHTQWIHDSLQWLIGKRNDTPTKFYRFIQYYKAPVDGLWQPNILPENVKKGMKIGTAKEFSSGKETVLLVEKDGILLWQHIGYFSKKGMILLGVAENLH